MKTAQAVNLKWKPRIDTFYIHALVKSWGWVTGCQGMNNNPKSFRQTFSQAANTMRGGVRLRRKKLCKNGYSSHRLNDRDEDEQKI